MLANFQQLYRYRDLLIMWTVREIKIRYKQSIVGGAWAILQPLSLMLVFTVVFSIITRMPTDGIPYPVFSYTALLPWTLLSTSMSFAVPSLVNNMNLVTKIYFPREILPMAAVAAAFFDFLIASVIFIFLLVFYQISITPAIAWLPLVLTIQIVLTMGIVLLLAALNVFYRDIRFVIPLATQIWLYATPIIYPLSLVREKLGPFFNLYLLNPMAGLVESYRNVILRGQAPEFNYLLVSGTMAVILFLVGYRFFKKAENDFADLI